MLLGKLVEAETAAMTGLDASAGRNVAAYEFLRIEAEAAVMRRRLGSVLVGLTPPEFDADAVEPAPAALIRARDAVRREGARMQGHVRSEDWDGASGAFQKAEAALDAVTAAAKDAAHG